MTDKPGKFRFAIDRGGTFTDVFALCPDNSVQVMKLLSVDPKNYRDAPVSNTTIEFSITSIKNPHLFFIFCLSPTFNRLREFDGSWKMKLGGIIRKMSRLILPISNG
jgi:hypothetical protein